MNVSVLVRRLPWLASVLVGCGDDSGGDGGTDSSTGDPTGTMTMTMSTSMTTSGADDSSTSGATGDTGTTGSNAAPEAVADELFGTQDDALVVDAASGLLINDTDPDGDPLSVTDFDAVSVGGGTVLVGNDGNVSYEPAAGFWGPDSFDYTVEDDSGEAASATVTVYVGPVQIPLADVTAGMGGFVLDGEAANHFSGRSVSGAGDVNGDGMDDLLVGAAGASPNGLDSGRSYVVFGVPTGMTPR